MAAACGLRQQYSHIMGNTKTSFFTKDPGFKKTFFPLLIVISLQQLAALCVNLVDNIMLGRYTELALSGATLVNQMQFMLQQLIYGTGTGVAVLGSQYWGKKRTEPICKITGIGVKIALAAGFVFFIVTKLNPTGVLSLFTNDTAVVAEGVKYLSIMCWTYLIFAVSNTLMYSLQSVETASVGTVMSLSTICINAVLNYCLIYGNLGCPELGIMGAAYATLTSRTVELIIVLVYILKIDKKLHMTVRLLLSFDVSYLSDFCKASLPVMASGILWGVAQAAQTAILGHMAATVIAANAIAMVVSQIFMVVGMSGANAASVTMGKIVGQRRFDDVKPYARTIQVIFLILGVSSCVLMLIFKNPIVSVYSVSEEAKTLARSFLTVMAFTGIGSCYEYPVEGGIIAGGGDPKYQAIVDTLFMWCFTIPVSALAAFKFGAAPIVVFWILKADQFLKCIPNAIVCNRYKWVKDLTKQNID